MKKLNLTIVLLMLFAWCSCTEEIVIDLEEGSPMIGVEGSFTNEFKRHEVILSYTADFYNSGEIKMITGAKVAVTDGVDTIPFLEQVDAPGHYLTDSVAGQKNTQYTLLVDVPDEEEGFKHLYAESYMNDNIPEIDSIVLKKNPVFPGIPIMDTIYYLYPYFQSLEDPSIVYLIHVTEDTIPQNDTLLNANMMPMAGYAGYYVNGPDMLEFSMEIPVCMIFESQLYDGKVIRLDLLSIPYDYMMFVYSVKLSTGSNPLMGSPSNVPSNVNPPGSAVGWFYAASVVSKEMVYHPSDGIH